MVVEFAAHVYDPATGETHVERGVLVADSSLFPVGPIRDVWLALASSRHIHNLVAARRSPAYT